MSKNVFSTLTIDGVTYTVDDKTKLSKPSVGGTEGQVLTKTADGTAWQDIAFDGSDYVLKTTFEETVGDVKSALDTINIELAYMVYDA
jgi:hypothetical protein